MHGNLSGPYLIEDISCRNRVVLTNKTPTGLNRGFGGPQHYYALERLVHKIANTLNLDHLKVIKLNLVKDKDFPYQSASGALLDSGQYSKLINKVIRSKQFSEMKLRKEKAIKNGKLYGIGYTAVVEPSVSNMGYITTALPYEEREKSGHKGGAIASASVAIGPMGGVYVTCDSLPQGQGHMLHRLLPLVLLQR
jgi:2-furoyl-CoA dehydrogenase large subunit